MLKKEIVQNQMKATTHEICVVTLIDVSKYISIVYLFLLHKFPNMYVHELLTNEWFLWCRFVLMRIIVNYCGLCHHLPLTMQWINLYCNSVNFVDNFIRRIMSNIVEWFAMCVCCMSPTKSDHIKCIDGYRQSYTDTHSMHVAHTTLDMRSNIVSCIEFPLLCW